MPDSQWGGQLDGEADGDVGEGDNATADANAINGTKWMTAAGARYCFKNAAEQCMTNCGYQLELLRSLMCEMAELLGERERKKLHFLTNGLRDITLDRSFLCIFEAGHWVYLLCESVSGAT